MTDFCLQQAVDKKCPMTNSKPELSIKCNGCPSLKQGEKWTK